MRPFIRAILSGLNIPPQPGEATIRATDPGSLFVDDLVKFTIVQSNPDQFASDAVCWPENGVTIGTVPGEFSNYVMLRCMAMHFNLHETLHFDVNGSVEIIYGHPTFLNKAFQPPFLSTWTDMNLTGLMQVPDINGAPTPCNVHYFKKTISSLDWDWISNNMQNRLSFFIGFFLGPPGTVFSNVYPESYEPLGSISAPYVKPIRDELMWDNAPSSRPATTSQATSWNDFGNRMDNANPGDVVAAPSGTFDGDGVHTITNVNGTPEQPIWFVGNQISGFPTSRLRGITGIRLDNCSYIRIYGFNVDQGTGNNNHQYFYMEPDSKWCVSQEHDFDDWGASNNTSIVHAHIVQGDYCRVSHSSFRNKQSPGGAVRLQPTSSDKAGQFCRFDHLECIGWNTLDLIPAGAQNMFMIAAGQNSNFDQRIHTMIDHNHLENYNKSPDDAEAGLLKGNGCIVWANYLTTMNGRGMNNRQGAWSVHIRNIETLGKFQASFSSMTTFQGNEDSNGNLTGELMVVGNWVEESGHANGWLQFMSVSSPFGNRFPLVGGLMAGNMGYNCRRRYIKLNGNSNTKPQDIHVIGNACECDEEVIQDQFNEADADISWSGNVFQGSSLGMPNPGGILEEDPVFVDRGDGIFLPTNPNIDHGNAVCYPVRLENKVIPNVGNSYT